MATKPGGRPPRPIVAGLVAGWILIAVKCLLTPWAIAHWQVPVHPGWVIVPTLIFASVVTVLIFRHDWRGEPR